VQEKAENVESVEKRRQQKFVIEGKKLRWIHMDQSKPEVLNKVI
jgi:hypothetical protein